MNYIREVQTKRNKRKHVTLTIQEKLNIINLVDSGHSRQAIATRYGVGKTTVHDIYKRKEKIANFAKQTQKPSDLAKRRRLDINIEQKSFVKIEECKEVVEEETLVENFEGFEYANEEYEIVYEPALVDTTKEVIQKSSKETSQSKLKNSSVKRKSKTLTLKEKYDVLKQLANGESVPKICQKYNIGRTTVYDFIKSKEKIFEYIEKSCDQNRKTFKRSNYPEIENKMKDWCRSNNQYTKQQFIDKCKQYFAEQKQINPTQFCGNWSWCKRFFERYPEFKRKVISQRDEFSNLSQHLKNDSFLEDIDTGNVYGTSNYTSNAPIIFKQNAEPQQLSHNKFISENNILKGLKYEDIKKNGCNSSEIIIEEIESENDFSAESLEYIESEFLPIENEDSQQDDDEYIVEELEHHNSDQNDFFKYEEVVQNEALYETTIEDVSDEEALRSLKILIKYSAKKGHTDITNYLIEYQNILEEELV